MWLPSVVWAANVWTDAMSKFIARQLEPDGLPATGYVRLSEIVIPGGPLPISSSQFWSLVKKRDIKSIKLSPKVTTFHVDEIRKKLINI